MSADSALGFQILRQCLLRRLAEIKEFDDEGRQFQQLLRRVCEENPTLYQFQCCSTGILIHEIGTLGELRRTVYGRDSSKTEIIRSIVKNILEKIPDEDLYNIRVEDLYRKAQTDHEDLGWNFVTFKSFRELAAVSNLKAQVAASRRHAGLGPATTGLPRDGPPPLSRPPMQVISS